jgi:hypothetical protein
MKRRVQMACAATTIVIVAVALVSGVAAASGCLIELTGGERRVEFHGLAPGEQRQWLTSVRNVSDEPVDLTVAVERHGALAAVMHVGVDRCDRAWMSAEHLAECREAPEPVATVRARADPNPPPVPLGTLQPGATWNGRFTATVDPAADDRFQGVGGMVRSTFTATGEASNCVIESEPPGRTGGPGPGNGGGPGAVEPPADSSAPPGPLARTGGDTHGLLVTAAALMLVGAALRYRRSRR